jgi:hypothetical protein
MNAKCATAQTVQAAVSAQSLSKLLAGEVDVAKTHETGINVWMRFSVCANQHRQRPLIHRLSLGDSAFTKHAVGKHK